MMESRLRWQAVLRFRGCVLQSSAIFADGGHVHLGADRAHAGHEVYEPAHLRARVVMGGKRRKLRPRRFDQHRGARLGVFGGARHSSSVMKGMKGCSSLRIWSRVQAAVMRASALAPSSVPLSSGLMSSRYQSQ